MAEYLVSISPAMYASLLAAFVATIGIFAAVIREEVAQKFSPYLAAFAAGLIVTTAIFLFPEALEKVPYAPALVLAGYLLLFGLNNVFGAGRIFAPLLAIGTHSFVDGLEYSILYAFEFNAAVVGTIGLVVHEFTEAVIVYTLLRLAKVNVLIAMLLAFVCAALTTPAGTYLAERYVDFTDPTILGWLLSFAVGTLLYVGTTHLIGHAREAMNRIASTWWYVFGIIIAISFAFSHSGGAEHVEAVGHLFGDSH